MLELQTDATIFEFYYNFSILNSIIVIKNIFHAAANNDNYFKLLFTDLILTEFIVDQSNYFAFMHGIKFITVK